MPVSIDCDVQSPVSSRPSSFDCAIMPVAVDCDVKYNDSRVRFEKESSSAYGYDIVAAIEEPVTIKPNEVVFVKTGISTHVKFGGFFGMIVSRPKLAARSGIIVANGVGIIEPDYQGEWVVALKNTSDVDFVVNPLDKIAKALFVCAVRPSFDVVNEFGSEGRTHKAFVFSK